ncbi:MAG: glycosyltransferase [Myxococcota bacterium]
MTSSNFPKRIGLLNDYVSVPYANGSSFASQFLYRELTRAGSKVTVVGPADPAATSQDLPERHLLLDALPLRSAPGVYLSMPTPAGLSRVEAAGFDLCLAQTSNALMDVGVWLRQRHRVPLVMVNTLHLASAYATLLPDFLDERPAVHELFKRRIVPFAERQTVDAYNRGDGLVVLSSGLRRYWRERGVRVPIHVIPRAIDESVFRDASKEADPFQRLGVPNGQRLLVVCRHVREKSLDRLLRIFALEVAPMAPNATLTLVGDGPEREALESSAGALGVTDRVFFAGEQPLNEIARWYSHADVFVYTSLSETYGQVISEAMWCGLPVVAFADGKGVSDQLVLGGGELLLPDRLDADAAFGAAALRLLGDPARRGQIAAQARRSAATRAGKERVLARYAEVFASAREHCAGAPAASDDPGVLGRWAGVHAVAYALGLLRPAAAAEAPERRPWRAA